MRLHPRLLLRSVPVLAMLALAGPHHSTADTAGIVIPLPAADKAQLDALLGENVVGEALPSLPLGATDSFLPPKGAAISYRVVVDKKQATTEIHKIEDTTEAEFSPGWRYSIAGVGTSYFKQGPDGGVYTVAEQDLDNKVLSRFTPGEPLIIPGLKPGESKSFSLKVEVYSLSDLKKVSHSGSLDVAYTYVGTYRVTVPAGTFDGALIRWDYSGKVGPANIKDSQYRFVAAGAGMVAMIQIRSISALLIYNDHSKRGKLLEKKQ